MIHTIGDSHAGGVHLKPDQEQAFNQVPGVRTNHLGPKLMFSVGRDGINLRNFGVADGDTVILCFGEIDCRCHVHKYKDNFRSNIDTIVDKYFDVVVQNYRSYSNLKVCIFNVPPPAQKHNTEENASYPFLGTDDERKMYVTYMNNALRKKCVENGFTFLDVYEQYCCENGFLSKSLSDGNVHIANPEHIINFMKRNAI